MPIELLNLRRECHKLTLLLAFIAVPVLAHHSPAEFDLSHTDRFDAIVTDFEWKNPHVYIQVDRLDEDGEVTALQIEADGVSMLLPNGWSRDSFSPGDRVIVEAYPSKRSAGQSLLGYSITKQDGSVFGPNPDRFGRSLAVGPSAASGIAGVWLARWEEGFFALPTGNWPLTATGERYAGGPEPDQNPLYHCVPFSSPRIMVIPVRTEIDVLPDRVLINVDWLDVNRVVYTDGRQHPADGERTIQGHSTGYWEGDTLVMDTILFAPEAMGDYGLPSGPGRHIEERLSLGEDGRTLNYTFTLEDPQYLRESVVGSGIWDYRPGLEASTVGCDLEAAQRALQPAD